MFQTKWLKFKYQKMLNLSIFIPLTLASLLMSIAESQSNCQTADQIMGCISCTDPSSQTLVYDLQLKKMTCLEGFTNCLASDTDQCIECRQSYGLNIQTNQCINTVPNCIQYQNGTCQICSPFFILENDVCYEKKIPSCKNYSFLTGSCEECQYSFLDPALDCAFNTSLCKLFNQGTGKCQICPNGTFISQSGMFCFVSVDKCIKYDESSSYACLLCEDGFFLATDGSCMGNYAAGVKQVALGQGVLCLDRTMYFNINSCESVDDPVNHCFYVNSSNTTCQSCPYGYYLLSSGTPTCKECSAAIDKCLVCSSSLLCLSCMPGYYPLTLSATSATHCMTCTSYNCLQCEVSQSSDGTPTVSCLSCSIGYTLFSGSCYKCADTSLNSSSYSIHDSLCIACSLTNCMHCQYTMSEFGKKEVCEWCADGYYLNSAGSCEQIPTTGTIVVGVESGYEILSKISAGIEEDLYNDQVLLMSSCAQTDGYICQCNAIQLTSLCTNITQTLDLSAFTLTTLDTFSQYPRAFRMAAQFPTFTISQLSFTSSVLLSQYQYWNLLSIYTSLIIRQQNGSSILTDNTKAILARIQGQISASMSQVFSEEKITILTGNGFYYKFIPKGINSGGTGDDGYISTTASNQYWRVIYIFYNRLASSTQLTGHIFTFTPTSTSRMNITVRKNGFISNTQNFTIIRSGRTSTAEQIQFNEGLIKIVNFSPSTASSLYGYQIFSTTESQVDIYQSQRIQYIFYSESFLYILFFILLYLIFLPLCSLVDCCEEKQANHRKRINSQEFSEGVRESQGRSDDETIIKVNYRDFFPIYNVGNTPRSKRLPKICLFIVNLQNGITFLTLIYFSLDAGNEVGAIGLAVPAYFCTIAMGYIVGGIFRVLPGRSKYLINFFSVGYWIIWIFLMRIFKSTQYKLFLLVFAVLFFFIDLLLDAFEMLLVYFSIKQTESESAANNSAFNCLAKWFSLRGYYQFDKLARQMNEQ